jgi:hypothetical protein
MLWWLLLHARFQHQGSQQAVHSLRRASEGTSKVVASGTIASMTLITPALRLSKHAGSNRCSDHSGKFPLATGGLIQTVQDKRLTYHACTRLHRFLCPEIRH